MSLKLVKDNINNNFIIINFIKKIKVYKIYKKNINDIYEDVFNSIFVAEDSSLKIDVKGFDSLIIIFDKIDSNANITFEDSKIEYSGYYECSFIKKNINSKLVSVEPILSLKDTNINISTTITLIYEENSYSFDLPIVGNYAATNIEKKSVSNLFILNNGNPINTNFYVYEPNQNYETDNFLINGNSILNKKNIEYTIIATLKFFSLFGSISESPILNGVNIVAYE